MSAVGYNMAEYYQRGDVVGWAGHDKPDMVRSQFNLLEADGHFTSFNGFGAAPRGQRKMFLHRANRKVLGKDIPNVPQEDGDCVSQGAKHATETLTNTQTIGQAAMTANPQEVYDNARLVWRPVFAPYYYGTGRLYVGNGQMGNEAGSYGSWQAAAMKYGTLFADEQECPPYSGYCAVQWGTYRKYIDKWNPKAKDFIVKTTTKVSAWDAMCDLICAGYPVTTASNIGYSMEPGRDGFHVQNARWGHQMMIYGVDETYREQYALIMNSWGDVHGHLKDFETGEDLPIGVLRVKRKDIEKHLTTGENYGYSSFNGFPDNSETLKRELFTLL